MPSAFGDTLASMARRSPSPRAETTRPRSLLAAAALLLTTCGPAAPPQQAPPLPDAPPREATPAPTTPEQPPPPAPATVSVRGKLLDHRGQPLALANVELRSHALAEPLRVVAGADGSFELAAPPGVVDLTLTGVDHLAKAVTLVLDTTGVDLTVKLPTHPLADAKAPAQLLLFRTPDSEQPEPHELTTNKAGERSVTLELPAGEVRYQLVGHVTNGHSTNGTTSTGHQYDGAGDYYSRLTVPGGKLTISFDPKQFPPSEQPGSLVFADPTSLPARAAALIDRVHAMDDALVQAQFAALERHEPAPTQPPGWNALQGELAAIAGGSSDLRTVAHILYFAHAPESRPEAAQLATTALRDIAPTDPLWSLSRLAFRNLLAIVPDPDSHQTTIDAVIDHHPDPEIGGEALLARLTKSNTAGDTTAATAAYTRLQAPRFADTNGALFSRMYDPARPLLPGKSLPDLDLELQTTGAAKKLDLEQFKGHPVLIDVWATWCKPCVAEMPELHALHKSHGRGPNALQILSIAMDGPQEVAKFRRGEWKMPWQHVIVPPDQMPAIYDKLGIIGIPATILLGPDGKIVAATPDLEIADVPTRVAAIGK